jgi:hypothetical protein
MSSRVASFFGKAVAYKGAVFLGEKSSYCKPLKGFSIKIDLEIV